MKQTTKFFLLTLGLVFSSYGFSLPEDVQQKIEIEADKVYLNKDKGSAIYEGNVVIKQGSLYIEADHLTITTSGDTKQYNQFTAKGTDGKTAKFKQQIDIEGNNVSGHGNTIFYSTSDSILEISGNGEIKRANDIISADSIKYFIKKNIFEAKKESNERVTMTLQPENDGQ